MSPRFGRETFKIFWQEARYYFLISLVVSPILLIVSARSGLWLPIFGMLFIALGLVSLGVWLSAAQQASQLIRRENKQIMDMIGDE